MNSLCEMAAIIGVFAGLAALPWPATLALGLVYVGARSWLGWATGEAQLVPALRHLATRRSG